MKRNNKQLFVWGNLILCVGIMLASFGAAVCVSGEISIMGAEKFFSLIMVMGTMGMMLVLPVVGRLTTILGQRNVILWGIIIQTTARIGMILNDNWVLYALFYLMQSIGGGFYISAAFVNFASVADPTERPKYFGYIAVANALGAIFGPIVVSSLYSMGGILVKISYFAHLPLVLLGFCMLAKDCPNHKESGAWSDFDYLGLLLSITGLGCMVLWLNLGGKMFAWLSIPSVALALISTVSLAFLIRREWNIANPVVPIRMLHNPRMRFSCIGCIVEGIFTTCSGTYCVMWIRMNYENLPGATFYTGTATLAQQVVAFLLGLFLGSYVAKKFSHRFKKFAISAMGTAMLASAILYCLKFTGTSDEGNVVMLGRIPVGMILIYLATSFGGFTTVVAQSTFSAFWQSQTSEKEIPAGQGLYNFAGSGSIVVFTAVVGVLLGNSMDYSIAFALSFVVALIGLIWSVMGIRFSVEDFSTDAI